MQSWIYFGGRSPQKTIVRVLSLVLLGAFGALSAGTGVAQESAPLVSESDAAVSADLLGADPESDQWEFEFEIYGLMPWVDLELPTGMDVILDLGEILEALEMTAMFSTELRKGRWGVSADVIYIDVDLKFGEGPLDDLEIKEWIIMPRVSYRLAEGDWGYFDLQGGVRYTGVDLDLNAKIAGHPLEVSGLINVWDYTGGVRGSYKISDKWRLGYYGEIGAGDSNLIGQAYAEFDYRVRDNVEWYFGFRYVYYQFGKGVPLENEQVYGPQSGLRIRF